MISRGILIGSRDTTYENREVYKIDSLVEYEYGYDFTGSTLSSNKVIIKVAERGLDKCCEELKVFSRERGSFIVVDENLNRIGGDHCVRDTIIGRKYTVKLDAIEDKEVYDEYELKDYGMFWRPRPYTDIEIEKIYGVCSDTAYNALWHIESTNMKKTWVENDTLMIELQSRGLRLSGEFQFMESYCINGINSIWYRIKCVNEIGKIPNKNVYNSECYIADLIEYSQCIINKELLDKNIAKIRYIAIEGEFVEGEYSALKCYDLVEQKIVTVYREEALGLIIDGILVIPLESASILKGENSNLEYVPLPDGKFVNIEGNIITYEEMEEYFMNKYGYFIDLYNVYSLYKEVSTYTKLNGLEYRDIKQLCIDAEYLWNMSKYDLSKKGVIRDTYTEMFNLKVKNDVLYNNNIAWIALENMRGNEIEIRDRKLIYCNLSKSVVLKDIDEIRCTIQISGNTSKVDITIQGEVYIWRDFEISGDDYRILVDNTETFSAIGQTLYATPIEYIGEDTVGALRVILIDKRDICIGDLVRGNDMLVIGKEWQLGYEDTYNVIADVIGEVLYETKWELRYKSMVRKFRKSILTDKSIADNISIDAVNDIMVDYVYVEQKDK